MRCTSNTYEKQKFNFFSHSPTKTEKKCSHSNSSHRVYLKIGSNSNETLKNASNEVNPIDCSSVINNIRLKQYRNYGKNAFYSIINSFNTLQHAVLKLCARHSISLQFSSVWPLNSSFFLLLSSVIIILFIQFGKYVSSDISHFNGKRMKYK